MWCVGYVVGLILVVHGGQLGLVATTAHQNKGAEKYRIRSGILAEIKHLRNLAVALLSKGLSYIGLVAHHHLATAHMPPPFSA